MGVYVKGPSLGPVHSSVRLPGRRSSGKVAAAVVLPLALVLLARDLASSVVLDVIAGAVAALCALGAFAGHAERRRGAQ